MSFEVYFFDQSNAEWRSTSFRNLEQAREFARGCRKWSLPLKQPYILRKGA